MDKTKRPYNVHHLRIGKKNTNALGVKSEGHKPIGPPSNYMNDEQKELYNEIVKLSAPGYLLRADSLIVEMAACMLYTLRGYEKSNGDPTSSASKERQLLFEILDQLGFSPAERRKVSVKLIQNK